MPKKSSKKAESTPKYDSTRERNVLLDEINKNVKSVAEGHSILVHKIDQINAKLEEHDKRFDTIETAVMENSKDIKSIKANLNELRDGQGKIKHIDADHEDRIKRLEIVR